MKGEGLSGNGVKCVMVIDEELPAGLAVNAAGVLAFTLGREVEGAVGHDVVDGSGSVHAGIVNVPIPVLKADAETVRDIRERAGRDEDIFMVDFSDVAQASRTYDEYEEAISGRDPSEIKYLGVAVYGGKKPVNKLTGNLKLLR